MENKFMNLAIQNAKKALEINEIPIGAVIIDQEQNIIGCGFNTRESTNSVIGHGEINAINEACINLNTWKLDNCIMYVTVEPCIMCYGAILQSRIKKVYIGSKQDDIKKSSYRKYIISNDIDIDESLINQESIDLMKNFFKKNIRGEKC